MSTVEPEGMWAVVRAWAPPWSHEVGPAEPADYVKAPGSGDEAYWYMPGSEDGWSWEQVVSRSVLVEIVREGVAP